MDFSSKKTRKESLSSLMNSLRTGSVHHQGSQLLKALSVAQEKTKKDDLEANLNYLKNCLEPREREEFASLTEVVFRWLGSQNRSSMTQHLTQMEEFSDTQSVRSVTSQKRLKLLLAVREKLGSADQKVDPLDQEELTKDLIRAVVEPDTATTAMTSGTTNTKNVITSSQTKKATITSSELELGPVTEDFLNELASDLTYQTFDVVGMRALLRGSIGFKQLMVCLVAYIKAGNNYSSSLTKSRKKSETANGVIALLGRLSVVSRKTSVDSITLSRIAICFPHILLFVRKHLIAGGLLADQFPGTCDVQDQDFALAVFHPNDEAYLKFHTMFSMVLSQASTDKVRKGKTEDEILMESKSWIRIAATGLSVDTELKAAMGRIPTNLEQAEAAFKGE
jgi:hypothetical protein